MSEIVHYKGILKKVKPSDNLTLQETAKVIFDKLKYKIGDYSEEHYPDDYVRHLCNADADYLSFNYKLYKIYTETIDPDDDIIRAALNKDGTIDFEVKYYSGGASMQEAIESALKKLDL